MACFAFVDAIFRFCNIRNAFSADDYKLLTAEKAFRILQSRKIVSVKSIKENNNLYVKALVKKSHIDLKQDQ